MKIISPALLIVATFSVLSTPAIADDERGSSIHLTIEEKKWIANHPKIRVASTLDWPPFDFVEDGVPKGLAIEHIELVLNKVGLEIEYTSGISWYELLEEFKNKNIDVMPVLFFNQEREHFTDFTEEYYHIKLGVLENTKAPLQIEKLSSLKVGIQKGDGAISVVRAKFPEINLLELPKNVDLVKGLSERRLDAIIGNPLVFYYYASREGIKDIQLNDYLDMSLSQKSASSFHVGVRKDWPILRAIIQKSMDTTSDREFFEIERKWGNLVHRRKINWALVSQTAGVISLIILFLIWNNRKLTRIVGEKTAKLREMNESLEHTVDVRTKELLKLNKELADAASTDPLTNAFNRRYFLDVAAQFVELSKREKCSLCVAMIDIDRFKLINDTHGHDVGDRVIQAVVQNSSNEIRASDVFARFGGEEFVLILPHTDMDDALALAERIRAVTEGNVIENISVTVSIGVSQYQPCESGIETAIKRADKALYVAKTSGRNQVAQA